MNKKLFYLAFIVAFSFMYSCNDKCEFNNNKLITDEFESTEGKQKKIIEMTDEGVEPESVLLESINKRPELYHFDDSNSELWKNESENNLKSANTVTINVVGYDTKVIVSSKKAAFPSGLTCESRIVKTTSYLINKYQYKKFIQIPKGATIAVPPLSIMASMFPIGILPGTLSTKGYNYYLASSDSINDTYCLVTECSEITHNLLGQQVFASDNPVIIPCYLGKPSDFIFKYQYTIVVW